ncbi:MAG: endonuclease/exonuclease/phosphatase family protein [Caldilineaceae bacterium]
MRDRIDIAAEDEFTVCTFNLLGLGRGSAQYPNDDDYNIQLRHRARVIAEDLRGCTIVGLQETGTPEDAQALADVLAADFALDYTAVAIPGPNTESSEFPLTVSLLARSDVVTVTQATALQACSLVDYEVRDIDGFCQAGTFPAFNRPPLVVEMTVDGPWGEPYPITVIVNHWKSKAGDESLNVLRRILQANTVADWIVARTEDDPQVNVVVLGDLNDYYGSRPVERLRQGVTPPLIHTYDVLPALDRYTYIFNGAGQVLDHILMTSSMRGVFAGIDPLHINADFPTPAEDAETVARHVSDHDPVQLTLRPAGAGWIGGNVGVRGVLISLRNSEGSGVGVVISDDRGDFRFWGLPPGRYRVDYKPPRGVTIQSPDRLLQVPAGVGLFLQPDVQIEQGVFGVEAVLVGAALMDSGE